MQEKELVVYTAISGHYDRLREPRVVSDACDYVCFSEGDIRSSTWSMRRFDEVFDDPVFTAKKPKVLPHRYFGQYKYSIWVDGNILIKQDPRSLIDKYLESSNLALFQHPRGRKSIAREAQKCVELGKDLPSRLMHQVKLYHELGYRDPLHGLPTCFVILRRHDAESVRLAMEEWWTHILCYGRRDQISLPFVLWKNQLDFELIEYDEVFARHFHRTPHKHRGAQGLARLLPRSTLLTLRSLLTGGKDQV